MSLSSVSVLLSLGCCWKMSSLFCVRYSKRDSCSCKHMFIIATIGVFNLVSTPTFPFPYCLLSLMSDSVSTDDFTQSRRLHYHELGISYHFVLRSCVMFLSSVLSLFRPCGIFIPMSMTHWAEKTIPRGTEIIYSHIVFDKKYKIDPETKWNVFLTWKVRLVFGGSKQKSYEDTFSHLHHHYPWFEHY